MSQPKKSNKSSIQVELALLIIVGLLILHRIVEALDRLVQNDLG